MVDIENILASLYANEINVSLSWARPRGFSATLGNPPLAEEWLQTSGEAVRRLKEQAVRHFPAAEFARERNKVHGDFEAILDDLYASKIDGSIQWIWDGGFHVSIGARKQKAERWSLETVAEAVEWLREEACGRYPNSEFARKHLGFGGAGQ
jgi:hypothetical protein